MVNAVTNENPNLRYLAGKDVETWLDSKKTCLIKQNLMK